ncbi:MAG TPA: hypothetical protein VGM06_20200 [Polyangiaceae bacterium]|jgi:hypothetical protein
MKARSSRAGGGRTPAWLAVLFVLGVSRSSWAQGAPPAVDVYVVGAGASLPRLQTALGAVDRPIRWASIDKFDLSEVTQPPPEPGGAPAARVWVDCSDPSRARLYFADWSTERFLLRDLPTPEGLTELSLETIAQMIETSLSALTTDRMAGMTRVEMGRALGEKPAAPAPRAEAVPSAPLAPSLGAFYAAQGFARDWPIEHGPGVAAELRQSTGRVRFGGWVTGQYQLPETIDDGLAGVQIDTFAIRAGVEAGAPIAGDAVVLGRIGAGGDILHVAPRLAAIADAQLQQEKFYWDTMVQLATGVQVRLNPHLELDAAIVVDVDLVLRHYDVNVDGGTTRFATPWPVRPGLSAGLSWR